MQIVDKNNPILKNKDLRISQIFIFLDYLFLRFKLINTNPVVRSATVAIAIIT